MWPGLAGGSLTMSDNRDDIFTAIMQEVEQIAEHVEAISDRQRTLIARADAAPSDEKLSAVRAEVLDAIEKAEKRSKDRSNEERQRIEENRHADKLALDRKITDTVNDERAKADKDFPGRLKDNLPEVLAILADDRRELLKRRLLQYTPWIALGIMLLTFLAQCVGIAPQAMGDLGNGIARIKG